MAPVRITALAALALLACGDDAPPGGARDAGPPADAGPAGRTFWLATDGDGDDDADGSREAPFASFGHAFGVLEPGDTLVVRDGRYGPEVGTDLPLADCGSEATACGGEPCRDGRPEAPITVRAENERRALLDSDGNASALRVTRCAHWTFEGLHAEVGDHPDGSGAGSGVVYLQETTGVTLRRLLVARPNRYANLHMVWARNSVGTTVEECELYDFHRQGITIAGGSHAVIRRNYVASRDGADLPDGYTCCCTDRAESGISILGAYQVLVENNVIEGACRGIDVAIENFTTSVNGPRAGEANRFLGNLVREARRGFEASSECEVAPCPPELRLSDIEVVDLVSIGTEDGIYMNGVERAVLRNVSSFEASDTDFWIVANPSPASAGSSFVVLDAQDTGGGSYGYLVRDQAEGLVLRANSHGNDEALDVVDATVEEHTTVDPAFGSCRAWAPEGSPLRGAGAEGRDIGARVVLRYENGRQTDVPLWDPDTGAFPCGAVVEGVNDEASHPGATCASVHERFGVGVAGCAPPPA